MAANVPEQVLELGPAARFPAPTMPYALASLIKLWRDLRRDKVALVGLLLVVIVVFIAVAAPVISPYDPAAQSLGIRLKAPSWLAGGAPGHLLGTDQLGRDILSRIFHGSRVSIVVGISVVLVAGTFGVFIGLLSGFYGGRVDDILMRLTDIQTAFPGLLLALVILTMIGPSVENIIIVLSINGWMVYARMTRGIMLSLREVPFIEAARTIGCSNRRIIFCHALPNLVSPLLTLSMLEMARIILAEASLSFLGLGIQPPASSWGLMIAEGRKYFVTAWWLVTFPGLAIALTVFGINLVASWLRVVSDPYQRYRHMKHSE